MLNERHPGLGDAIGLRKVSSNSAEIELGIIREAFLCSRLGLYEQPNSPSVVLLFGPDDR
jgi:hypothetical protein